MKSKIPKTANAQILAFLFLINTESAAQNAFVPPDPALWIDKEIIFLPIDTSDFLEPYNSWSVSRIKTITPKPAQVYRRRGVIIDVEKKDNFDPYYVTVNLLDSDTLLYGFSLDGHLRDIAFIDEIKTAQKYVGAILWNNRSIFYTHDSVLNVRKPQVILNLEPLYLWKTTWSDRSEKPIRLILFEPGGIKIFIDLNFSELNLSPVMEPAYLEKIFHKVNPRIANSGWDKKLWQKIENEAISKNMSREAVLLSWGNPVNAKSRREDDDLFEIWSYDREPFVIVTFRNGLLESWEIRNIE